MNKNTRFGIIAIALAGLAGLGYYAYTANRSQAAGPAAPSGVPGKPAGGGAPTSFPTAVEVARVVASDFADDVAAVGTLKSNESVVLRPETSGRIASIGFRDGSIVAKGTVLVVFDAAIQDAELLQARANLALAKSSYARNVELVGKKFLSQQALDASAATLKVQEAAVKLAEAKAAKMRIKAPFKGMVGLRNVSVGDYLKDGQDLINIEDVATLRVDFKLPESYLGRLGKGQSLEVVSDALPVSVTRLCSMRSTRWSTRTVAQSRLAPASTTPRENCARGCSFAFGCFSASARVCSWCPSRPSFRALSRQSSRWLMARPAWSRSGSVCVVLRRSRSWTVWLTVIWWSRPAS